jgi:hypothetical protein
VLYTADMRALETDEIFVDFITGNHDAFVIEDADHLLMARSNGNVDLHRFLGCGGRSGPRTGPEDHGADRGRARGTKSAGKCGGVGGGYALDNARSVVSAGGC